MVGRGTVPGTGGTAVAAAVVVGDSDGMGEAAGTSGMTLSAGGTPGSVGDGLLLQTGTGTPMSAVAEISVPAGIAVSAAHSETSTATSPTCSMAPPSCWTYKMPLVPVEAAGIVLHRSSAISAVDTIQCPPFGQGRFCQPVPIHGTAMLPDEATAGAANTTTSPSPMSASASFLMASPGRCVTDPSSTSLPTNRVDLPSYRGSVAMHNPGVGRSSVRILVYVKARRKVVRRSL